MSVEWFVIIILFILLAVIILMLAGVGFLGYKLIKLYPVVTDQAAPSSLKTVFWLAALYVISPIDLMPDPILVDDIIALVGAAGHISKKGRELGLGSDKTNVEQLEKPPSSVSGAVEDEIVP